jgi:excisionase family DNA binding protein
VQDVKSNRQKLVSKREIAHRYGVSARTIQEWMEKAMIPFYKPGYMVRFDPEECDIALNRFKVPLGGCILHGPDTKKAPGSDVSADPRI